MKVVLFRFLLFFLSWRMSPLRWFPFPLLLLARPARATRRTLWYHPQFQLFCFHQGTSFPLVFHYYSESAVHYSSRTLGRALQFTLPVPVRSGVRICTLPLDKPLGGRSLRTVRLFSLLRVSRISISHPFFLSLLFLRVLPVLWGPSLPVPFLVRLLLSLVLGSTPLLHPLMSPIPTQMRVWRTT
jgi:hypothetical protein